MQGARRGKNSHDIDLDLRKDVPEVAVEDDISGSDQQATFLLSQ